MSIYQVFLRYADMFLTSFLSCMWSVGINMSTSILLATPTSLGGYGMSLNALGYLYFAPIIAIIIGEALGHWANDVSSRFTECMAL